MTAGLESDSAVEDGCVTPSWTLTVTDRRLMWLQKQRPGASGHKLQLWASEAFKERRTPGDAGKPNADHCSE